MFDDVSITAGSTVGFGLVVVVVGRGLVVVGFTVVVITGFVVVGFVVGVVGCRPVVMLALVLVPRGDSVAAVIAASIASSTPASGSAIDGAVATVGVCSAGARVANTTIATTANTAAIPAPIARMRRRERPEPS